MIHVQLPTCPLAENPCQVQLSGGEGGGERRGLGLRNDVLTTCKAGTLCGGHFRSEKRREYFNNKKTEKITSCLYAFLAYRTCPLVLKLQNTLGTVRHCMQLCKFLNQQQHALKTKFVAIDRVYK